jgi:hypothetical protein
MLEEYTMRIGSGPVMKMLKRFVIQRQLRECVRSLDFPNFHYFSSGALCPAGHRFGNVNGDVQVMNLYHKLKKVQFKIECNCMDYDEDDGYICLCHTEEMIKRNQTYRVLSCNNLEKIVINISVWKGRAENVKAGGDSFCYGEELA